MNTETTITYEPRISKSKCLTCKTRYKRIFLSIVQTKKTMGITLCECEKL